MLKSDPAGQLIQTENRSVAALWRAALSKIAGNENADSVLGADVETFPSKSNDCAMIL